MSGQECRGREWVMSVEGSWVGDHEDVKGGFVGHTIVTITNLRFQNVDIDIFHINIANV